MGKTLTVFKRCTITERFVHLSNHCKKLLCSIGLLLMQITNEMKYFTILKINVDLLDLIHVIMRK